MVISMPPLPDPTLFNYMHKEWLSHIEFYRMLIANKHKEAPIEADHPFNVEKVKLDPSILSLSHSSSLSNTLSNNQSIPEAERYNSSRGNNERMSQGKRPRGRPLVHQEFAHMSPKERNRNVRAKYQRMRRAMLKESESQQSPQSEE